MSKVHEIDNAGNLRSVIETARDAEGGSLADYTVMTVRADPYRLDTPDTHKVGKWLADQMDRLNLMDRRLHLRGIHYALLASTMMPNGEPYTNTDENWAWLQFRAAKAARWLGYVPFEAITDARNAEPIIRDPDSGSDVHTFVAAQPHITLPEFDNLDPAVFASGFEGQQPYRLALYGEKSSLEPILRPMADRYNADLYLPTGEITDTQMHMMAKAAAEDGRPLIVFTLTDFDPAGWQMSISIGRKLQALKDLKFPELEFEVHPIGLTRDQAITFNLPSTPLKTTELRGDKWRAAWGREQTEIDALATLRPDDLRGIIEDAMDPFYDWGLDRRVEIAEEEWRRKAQKIIDVQLDHAQLEEIKDRAEEHLREMHETLEDLAEEISTETEDLELIDLPDAEVPGPEIDHSLQGEPLISSEWDWTDQTRSLKARKSYEDAAS